VGDGVRVPDREDDTVIEGVCVAGAGVNVFDEVIEAEKDRDGVFDGEVDGDAPVDKDTVGMGDVDGNKQLLMTILPLVPLSPTTADCAGYVVTPVDVTSMGST
jgi:hypothetical protein